MLNRIIDQTVMPNDDVFALIDMGIAALPENHRFDFNVADIAEVWRRGSVVSSWLLDLTAIALAEDPALARYSGFVEDSGEGRWTVQAAIDQNVPAPVITLSLLQRIASEARGF